MFRRHSSCETNEGDIIKKSENGEKDKNILSPRAKEAASVFKAMGVSGVHRLRPRRSNSVPVSKSKAMYESQCGEKRDELALCSQAKTECFEQNKSMQASDDNAHTGEVLPPAEKETLCREPLAQQGLDSSTSCTTPCIPQKPSEARAAPSRPLRSRPSSHASHPLSAAHKHEMSSRSPCTIDSYPSQSSTGLAQSPKTMMGSMRPPTMPTTCHTAAKESELERPSSRAGQRPTTRPGSQQCPSRPGSPERPSSRREQRPTTRSGSQQCPSKPCSPTPWVRDWAEQAGASRCGGHGMLQRAPMKRSSSCRPEGIDRWHFVARVY